MSYLARLRDALRTLAAVYPIPFMQTSLSIFALGCFGLTAATGPSLLSWIFAEVGGVTGLSAVVLVTYAVVWHPELLRVERHIVAYWREPSGEKTIKRRYSEKIV